MLKLDFEGTVEKASFDDFKETSASQTDSSCFPASDRIPLCLDLEKAIEHPITGIKPLMSLLDCLAQACDLITPSQPTKSLSDLEQSLDSLVASINLWKIAGYLDTKDERIWDMFLSVLFKIPERFVAVFERSSMTISNPRIFHIELFRDLFEEDLVVTSCSSRLLSRILGSGFQDEFFSCLVQNDSDGRLTLPLAKSLSASKASTFVQLYMNAAFIESKNTAELVLFLNHLHPWLVESSQLTASLFEETIKYQNVPINAAVALISLLLWHDGFIDLSMLIKRIFNLKLTSSYSIKLAMAFMSFVPGYELATENQELIRMVTEALTRWLNDPSPQIRVGSMVLAECYGRASGSTKPLYFDLDETDLLVLDYRGISNLVREVDLVLHSGQCFTHYEFQKPLLEAAVETIVPEEFSNVKLAPSTPAPKSIGSAPEAWNGEPRNSKLRHPNFLRDCLEFLRSEDPDKWELALDCLPSVMDHSFQMELKEFALPLFKSLLFLSDQFKLTGFEQKRMVLLGDLMLRIPENSLRMLKCEFVGRSLNLGQKSDILTLVMTTLKSLYLTKTLPVKEAVNLSDLLSHISIKDDFEAKVRPTPFDFPVLVRHFLLPLLAELQDAMSKTFLTAHDFLLEKTILCISIFFYLASNSLHYPQMIASGLPFLRPVIMESSTFSAPIHRATLQCLHAVFSTYPEHLPIAPLFEDIVKISSFSNEIAANSTDPELVMLCAKMQASMLSVADLRRICKENMESSSLDITQVATKLY